MKFDRYAARLIAAHARVGSTLELRSPARAPALQALERQMGVRLPQDVRAAWMKTNGAPEYRTFFARPGYLTGYDFLSVAAATKTRSSMKRRAPNYARYEEPVTRDARIEAGWFHPHWLPYAAFGGGSLVLMLDFAPRGKGRSGQIIAFTHDPDRIEYVSSSWERFLGESIAAIEANGEELLGQA